MGNQQWSFLRCVILFFVILPAISGSEGSSAMMSPISHGGRHMDSPFPSHPRFFESSPVMSPVPHEIKPPLNAHAPLASHLQPSGPSSPIRNPMPHEERTPSMVTFAPRPSPFEVKNSSNTTHAPFYPLTPASSPVRSPSPYVVKEPSSAALPLESSPLISPVSHEMKEPSNNTQSPLPSHQRPSEYFPANSLAPHEAAGPTMIAHSPLTSHPSSPGLSPTISPVNSSFPSHSLSLQFSPTISPTQHEVKDPSNITHAPLASDPKRLRTSPMVSPPPHEVKDPSNITHSHLPLHFLPEFSPLPSSHFASKDPSNIMHAPLSSHPVLSRIPPMVSPTPHEMKEPANVTVPSLPSHVFPLLSSPIISPTPHKVRTPSNVTLPPLSSHPIPSPYSPMISPVPHEIKKHTNSTRSPLPSHLNPSEDSPAVSPLPHEVGVISNVTQAPLVSPPHLTGSSPLLSPMPYEVKNATHITHAPFSSHHHSPSERMIQTPALAPTISRPQHGAPLSSSPSAQHQGSTISPVPSHNPEVPSHSNPSQDSPAVSPLPHEVGVISNVTHAPLVSPPHLTGSSPLLSPMPYEVKNSTSITHAPFSSHHNSPSERMIQTPASAPTISRPQHGAPLSSSPSAHYSGSTISPVPSHNPEVPSKNIQKKYAPSPYIRGPSISPNQFLPHPHGVVPKHNQRNQAPLLSPVQAPIPSKTREVSYAPSPSPVIPSWHNKWHIHPPLSSRKPRAPSSQLVWELPPPPPNLDCKSLSCQEPVTYPPPGSLCVCVLPIKVSLRLSIALYTFFPLVTELSQEITSGIFVKQSQVRIMGANAASEDPEKTVVLIYLVPLGRTFDINTALLIYERFWHKQVLIKASYFGNFDVLYVVYPGLPPSPPMAPGDVGVDGGTPTNGENARRIKPLGVDVRKRKEKNSGSFIAILVLSSVIALVISVAAAWILLIRRRSPNRTPSTSLQPLSPVAKLSALVLEDITLKVEPTEPPSFEDRPALP